MDNFQKQLSETTKTVQQTVSEMTPVPASPTKKAKKWNYEFFYFLYKTIFS